MIHQKFWLCIILAHLQISMNTCFADSQSGLSSDALIGIVVAAVSVFLLIIGVIVVCFIFGLKERVFKQSTSEEPEDFLDTRGVTLSADIPVEALNREPPPRYTPRLEANNTARTTSSATRTGRASHTQRDAYVSTVLPPPYYASSDTRQVPPAINDSLEIPPVYRSQVSVAVVEIDNNAARTGRRAERGRQFNRTMDSFTEYPSMSEILLTSSRSSLPAAGLSSRGASRQNRSERSENTVGQTSSQMNESAREDNARTNRADEVILGVSSSRARSVSLVDVSRAAATVGIPDGGLGNAARRHTTRHNLASIDETITSSSSTVPSSSSDNDPAIDVTSESINSSSSSSSEIGAPMARSSDTSDANVVLESRYAKDKRKRESNISLTSPQNNEQSNTNINTQIASRSLPVTLNEEHRKGRKVVIGRTTEV